MILEYAFWIALVSPVGPVGPVLALLTTELIQRRTVLVALPLLMAAIGFLLPYAGSGLAVVCVGAAIQQFSL